LTELPEPLVPAEVDLTDFAFMPLDVRKLRDSRFTATVEGESFKAGLLLWGASWHQSPASSLPDDDVELAQLAGFGRVVKEWKKRRAAALYGWVLCSDGRLYHPTIAEKACEAWRSKLMHAYGRMCDRIRKANKARAESKLKAIGIPDFDAWNSGGRSDPLPPEHATTSTGIPAETSLKGQGELRDREGNGQGSGLGAPGAGAPSTRGSRLQPDWTLPKAWGDWAMAEYPLWTPEKVRREAAGFRDHWCAKAGKDASKVDWQATWRQWCRSDLAHRDDPKPNGRHPVSTAERNAEAKRLLGFTIQEEMPHA
jgi:hypothetical protein